MMLILEGSDACFKSTIANKLSEKLSLPVVHGSSFELAECDNTELYDHFDNLAQADNVIYDRLIYSNQVYATIFTDYTILSDNQRHDIEDKIKDKAIVIHLYADEDVIANRLGSRGDEYIDKTHIHDILTGYQTAMENAAYNGVTVVSYDTGKYTSNQIVDDIVSSLP